MFQAILYKKMFKINKKKISKNKKEFKKAKFNLFIIKLLPLKIKNNIFIYG